MFWRNTLLNYHVGRAVEDVYHTSKLGHVIGFVEMSKDGGATVETWVKVKLSDGTVVNRRYSDLTIR